VVENLLRSPSDCAIIDVNGKDNDSPGRPGIKDTMVILGAFEAQVDKRLIERLVPGTACLLESVNCLSKLGDETAAIRSFESARWKLHEDLLIEISIKECTEEIEDLDRPVFSSGHGEDSTKAGEFGNGCKGLSVVDTIDLGETSSDKTAFVLGNLALGVLLDLEDPFGPNDVLARRSFDNIPSIRLL